MIATGPNTVVRVPIAIEREVESYDLTVRMVNRAGAPSTDHIGFVYDIDSQSRDYVTAEPTTTVRLPRGRYFVNGHIREADGAVSFLAHPWLELTVTPPSRWTRGPRSPSG